MRALRLHGIVEEVDEVVVAEDVAEALEDLEPVNLRKVHVQEDELGHRRGVPTDVGAFSEEVVERVRDHERTELLPIILFSSSREDSVHG
jgi:hypothetical protein